MLVIHHRSPSCAGTGFLGCWVFSTFTLLDDENERSSMVGFDVETEGVLSRDPSL